MISDRELHEIAGRLRGICYYEDDESGVETCDGVDIIKALGLEPTGPFFADDFPRSEVDRLADLIDRPTCRDLVNHKPDPFIPGKPMTDGFFHCSKCGWHGQLFEYIDFSDMLGCKAMYCPHCGAEIVEREMQIDHPKSYGINAKTIKKWLTDNDMTQKELAEKIGVSQSAFGKWLQRPAEIGMGKVFALSDATGLDIHDLVVPLDDAD